MKIDRKKLLELYMQDVNELADKCEHVSHLRPPDIIGILSAILETHPELLIKENEENT